MAEIPGWIFDRGEKRWSRDTMFTISVYTDRRKVTFRAHHRNYWRGEKRAGEVPCLSKPTMRKIDLFSTLPTPRSDAAMRRWEKRKKKEGNMEKGACNRF